MSELTMSREQLRNLVTENIEPVTPEDREEFGWPELTELGIFRCVDGGDDTEEACGYSGLWESALNVPGWVPACFCGRPAHLIEVVLN